METTERKTETFTDDLYGTKVEISVHASRQTGYMWVTTPDGQQYAVPLPPEAMARFLALK